MSFIVNGLQGLSPVLVYVVVAALVFGETGLFVGFVLPGETAVVIGGFVASRGHVSIGLFCAVAVVAVILGSSVGYLVGTIGGNRLLELRILRRHRAAIDRALERLSERGAIFVFVGRFVAFFRTVVPGLAGMSDLSFARFTVANVASALVWGPGWALVGYFAGNAYKKVEHYSGLVGIGLAVLVVVWFGGRWLARLRRAGVEGAGPTEATGEQRGAGDPAVQPAASDASTLATPGATDTRSASDDSSTSSSPRGPSRGPSEASAP